MKLDFDALNGRERYGWMIDLVVPRPIGWVSTIDRMGRANLAPFSFFQAVCASPPLLMVAVGDRRVEGRRVPKDTILNARETGECVIHLPRRDEIERVVRTAAELERGVSEFEFARVESAPADRVRPPRVATAAVAFECRVEEIVERPHWSTRLLVARVLCAHVDDALVGEDGRLRPGAWSPVARLGGSWYAELGPRFEVKRPD